jgi:hypothetical protein
MATHFPPYQQMATERKSEVGEVEEYQGAV